MEPSVPWSVGELRDLVAAAGATPSLANVQAPLERMPADLLIDGPPPMGKLLLRRTAASIAPE